MEKDKILKKLEAKREKLSANLEEVEDLIKMVETSIDEGQERL